MKPNNKEIIYKESSGKECGYCGISSFDHVHPPNTLPKDFMVAIEDKPPKNTDFRCRYCNAPTVNGGVCGHPSKCPQGKTDALKSKATLPCTHEWRACEWNDAYDDEHEINGEYVAKVFCIHCLTIKEL